MTTGIAVVTTATRKTRVKVKHLCILAFIVVLLTTSCSRKKVYDSYVHNHTAQTGWERNDTVSFNVPSVAKKGVYDLSLKLRTDNNFPFTSVVLIVKQTILPSRKHYTDTLKCPITDVHGHSLGKGINLYQHDFHIASRQLSVGDSLYVNVYHDMMREILPGIIDVGLKVSEE